MQLPEDFPHTRREQYVMVLPVELLSGLELATRARVLAEFRVYTRDLILPLLAEAASRELTTEEFAAEFVAAFEGPLPPVFARQPN